MDFQKLLLHAGYNVFVRTPRGQDISAACGQLGETLPPQGPKKLTQAHLDALAV
jgi:hypothetical protein